MCRYILLSVFFSISCYAQNTNISNTTINTCDAIIYDDGGPSGDYTETNYTMTVCAATGTDLYFTINALRLGSNTFGSDTDDLIIYEGSDTTGAVLFDSNTNSPQNIYDTNATCITIQFIAISPGVFETEVADGFEIVISCTIPETCNDGILNNGELFVDCGGPNCTPCISTDVCEGSIVSNGDFETTISVVCGAAPDTGFGSTNQIPRLWYDQTPVENWFGTAIRIDNDISFPTSDYFANCTNTGSIGCMDGSGSVGYWAHFSGGQQSEYIQTLLNEPLEAGEEYCISIRASTRRGRTEGGADTDKLAFWFHNNTYASGNGFVEYDNDNGGQTFMGTGSLVNGSPQVINPSGQMITEECQDFNYSFCADGGEQYLMVGNFTPGDSDSGQAEYVSVDNLVVRKSCPLSFDMVINDGGGTTNCTGSCITLTAAPSNQGGGCEVTNDFTYQWLEDGVILPGETNDTIEICPSGSNVTYTVQVTYNAGCRSITLPFDYEVNCCNSNAGGDGTLDNCSSDTIVNLFDLLSGTPDTGGIWSGPSVLTNGDQGTFDPSINTSGIYTYTVSGTNCSDAANIEVTINDTPELTIESINCSSDGSTYNVAITPNPNTANITTSSGTVSGNAIIDIPSGVNITISLDNNGCNDSFDITSPDCGGCGVINNPTNPNNPTICEGSLSIELTVEVPAGIEVNWYTSETEVTPVFTGIPFTPAQTDPGEYTYYAEAFESATSCSSNRIPVTLTILANPIVDVVTDIEVCERYILPSLTVGNYYTATNGGGSLLNVGDEIITSQTIYIYAESGTTPNCSDEAVLNITINPLPNPIAPVSDSDQFCGSFPLPPIIAEQSYFTGPNGTGNQLNPGDLIVSSQTLYLQEISARGCISEVEFFVNITNEGEVELPSGGICIDASEDDSFIVLDTFLSTDDYSFEWTFNGTIIPEEIDSSIIATEPGEYMVTFTNSSSAACSGVATTSIEAITGPEDLILELSFGQFANNNSIIATVIGSGQYEYSLDGGPIQDDNVFQNVSLGLHQVTAFDKNNCGEITREIFVIGFPDFFTPNNDGNHDYWNVIADFDIPDMDIFIFDRYGKLLAQVDPNDPLGWDGTYNNINQPATDYWFTAQYKDGSASYRGHFSLIR
ncbi:T9SS type B sorting domain-containing protein [Aquimarina sp. MMG016]|uniref:T9SS type B sorting domain-containing protein n=1 Tax=Aquimarina sp. MMG016 TaxID=2822690 RepID=UPI001B3A5541|nr:T9SS type B sorting domain-containing protein [Aquimarina sp. MMG016]MBQ4818593.1 T9SS type B sorting domain-containing protein [Aquimarina sp. MMG016]